MSKHPLGPWSSTEDLSILAPRTSVTHTGGKNAFNGTTGVNPMNRIALSVAKTGVNNGKRTSKPSPATLAKTDMETHVGGGSCRWFYASEGRWITSNLSNLCSISALPTSLPSTAVQEAAAFQKLIQKEAGGFKALVSAGEFKETLESFKFLSEILVGGHNKAYQALVKNLRRNKKGSISDIAKAFSDLWLEYHFSVLPTISDIDNLMNALHDQVNNARRPARVRASYKNEYTSNITKSTQTIQTFSCNVSKWSAYKQIVKFGYTLKPEYQGAIIPWNEAFGLTWRDVVPSLYELTPYSWLLDYVTNVGDYVNLLSLQRSHIQDGWRVIINDVSNFTSASPGAVTFSSTKPKQILSSRGSVCVARKFSFSRSPYDLSTFVPSFRFKVPSLAQAANVAALAGSRLIKPTEQLSIFDRERGRRVNDAIRSRFR